MTRLVLFAFGLAALAAIGCDAPELPASATTATTPATPPPAEPEPELVAGIPGPPLPEIETPVTDVPRKFTAKDPIKGRRTRAQGGVAGNFGAAIWAKYEGFVMAIDHSNQLYWPQNNFSYPKSHDEFMKVVVTGALAGEALPELEADHEYIYVPEQGEVGLQIRLVPGSPDSKIPKAEPGKEHVFDPAVLAEHGVVIPAPDEGGLGGEELSPDPRERAEQLRQRAAQNAAPAQPDPQADQELSPNLRERAGQLNERANSRAEEHGVAPGGLAPVGGLGVDGF
jgi:hypothetical protein